MNTATVKFYHFLRKAEEIVAEHRSEYKGVYYMKGGWNGIRDTLESAASLAGNYLLPGSSLLTDHLVSNGSQDQLNSTIGKIAQLGTGLTGSGIGSSFTGIPSASSIGAGWENALNSAGNLVGSPRAGTGLFNGVSNMFNGGANTVNPSVTNTPGDMITQGTNAAGQGTGFSPLKYANSDTSSLFNQAAKDARITPATNTYTGNDLNNIALGNANDADINRQTMLKYGLDPTGQTSPLSALAGGSTSSASGNTAPSSTLKNILKLTGTIGPLISALRPATYPGTLTQPQLQDKLSQQAAQQQGNNTAFIAALNAKPLARTQTNPNIDYYSYGSRPEQQFYDNINPQMLFPNTNPGQSPVTFKAGGEVKHMAMGGLSGIPANNTMRNLTPHGLKTNLTPKVNLPGIRPSPLQLAQGGDIPGGQTDNIPAQLSAGEYIIPADVVSALGDGDTSAGAKKLDAMRAQVRQHKSGALAKGKLPPKAKSPLLYATGAK